MESNPRSLAKNVFSKDITLIYGLASLGVSVFGIAAVFFNQAVLNRYSYNDNTLFNSVVLICLAVSILPCIGWLLIYKKAKNGCAESVLSKTFNKLKIYSIFLLIIEIAFSSLIIALLLVALFTKSPGRSSFSWTSVMEGIVRALIPVFIGVVLLLGTSAVFYSVSNLLFLNNVSERLKNPEFYCKSGKSYFVINIIIGVIFALISVYQLTYFFSTGPNRPTTWVSKTNLIVTFVYFAVIAVKHIFEANVARSYYKVLIS